MSKKIEQLIVKAGTAINNSLQNQELQQMLAEYGYNAEKLTGGKALLENASTLNIIQVKEEGEKTGATNLRDKTWEHAHKDYMRFVKMPVSPLPTSRAHGSRWGYRATAKNPYLAGWHKYPNFTPIFRATNSGW